MVFRSSVSVYFGEALDAGRIFRWIVGGAQQLKRDLDVRLKSLFAHVDDTNRYDEIVEKIGDGGVNYLDPVETNERIALRLNRVQNLL